MKKIFSMALLVVLCVFVIFNSINVSKPPLDNKLESNSKDLVSTKKTNNINYLVGNESNGIVSLNEMVIGPKIVDLNTYKFYRIDNYGVNVIYVADVTSCVTDVEISGIQDISINTSNYINSVDGSICEIGQIEIVQCFDDVLYVTNIDLDECFESKLIEESFVINDIELNDLICAELLRNLNFKKDYILDHSNSKPISLSQSDVDEYSKLWVAGPDPTNPHDNPGPSPDPTPDPVVLSEYVNDQRTIKYGAYDSYTSHDSIIHQYATDCNYRNQIKVRDPNDVCVLTSSPYYNTNSFFAFNNPIVKIIPIELFRKTGTFSYIGTEYGFYIKTVVQQDENISNYIFFDIEKAGGGLERNLKIIPLYSAYTTYNNKYKRVMENTSGSRLALSNIDVAMTVSNLNAKNIGDDGYVDSEDNGLYVYSYYLKANTRLKNSQTLPLEKENFSAECVESLLSYIPVIGTGISILQTAYNVGSYVYQYEASESTRNKIKSATQEHELDGPYNSNYIYQINYTNKLQPSDMITLLGHLVKGYDFHLKDSKPNQLSETQFLYKPGEPNYFYISYGFAKTNFNKDEDAELVQKVNLNIVKDNTKFNSKSGSVEIMDRVDAAYVNTIILNPKQTSQPVKESVPTLVSYATNDYQEITFTPSVSGWYDLETYGTNSDTYMSLYSGNQFLAADNNNGRFINIENDKKCSLIHKHLTSGLQYKIRIKGAYNYFGSAQFIIKKVGSGNITESLEDYYKSFFNEYYGNSKWNTFTPTRSDYYAITTKNATTDTYLKFYDSNHNLLAFDDDSGAGRNAKIRVFLTKGQTYFIESKPYSSSVVKSTFNIIVYSEETTILNKDNLEYGYSDTYYIEEGYKDAVYILLKPDTTGNYRGRCTSISYNYMPKDKIKMHILDSDFHEISFDLTNNYDTWLDYDVELQAGKEYYVVVSLLNPAEKADTQFDFFVDYH